MLFWSVDMKAFVSLTAILSMAVVVAVFVVLAPDAKPVEVTVAPEVTEEPVEDTEGEVAGAVDEPIPDETPTDELLPAEFGLPMSDALARVTKKPFGLHITPETSPVENDRFSGYHVGVDFETFAEEQDIEIPIAAICDGPLILKKQANGYGGVAVQACKLDGEDVTIVYGHLALESIAAIVGQELKRGEQIGRLGQGYSEETDGVRKHLHLGIHQGSTLELRGYVQNEEEVSAWLDAQNHLPQE